jgi:hypothetical protein
VRPVRKGQKADSIPEKHPVLKLLGERMIGELEGIWKELIEA